MGKSRYLKTYPRVRDARKVDNGYVVDFSNGVTMGFTDMEYKIRKSPKKGDEYLMIEQNGAVEIFKSYPTKVKKRKAPSIRKKGTLKVPPREKAVA